MRPKAVNERNDKVFHCLPSFPVQGDLCDDLLGGLVRIHVWFHHFPVKYFFICLIYVLCRSRSGREEAYSSGQGVY